MYQQKKKPDVTDAHVLKRNIAYFNIEAGVKSG